MIKWFIKKAGIYNQGSKKFSKYGYILFNILLYDSIMEILKALFPPYEIMKFQYEIKSKKHLPYYYIKRFQNLLIKRASL